MWCDVPWGLHSPGPTPSSYPRRVSAVVLPGEQRKSLERAREDARLASHPHRPGSQRRSSGGARSSDRVGRKAWLRVLVRGTRCRLEVSHTNADKRLCDSWCPRSLCTLTSSRTQQPSTPQSDTRKPCRRVVDFRPTLAACTPLKVQSLNYHDNTSPAMCSQEKNRSDRMSQERHTPHVSRHGVIDDLH